MKSGPTAYGIGIDTGGTYTDAVLFDLGERQVIRVSKRPTIHHCLERSIVEALDDIFPVASDPVVASLLRGKGATPADLIVQLGMSDIHLDRRLEDLAFENKNIRSGFYSDRRAPCARQVSIGGRGRVHGRGAHSGAFARRDRTGVFQGGPRSDTSENRRRHSGLCVRQADRQTHGWLFHAETGRAAFLLQLQAGSPHCRHRARQPVICCPRWPTGCKPGLFSRRTSRSAMPWAPL